VPRSLPYRPATRPFALVRTRDQWQRAAHDGTEIAPGGVVQLASTDDASTGPVTGTPVQGTGLAFDSACRLYHSILDGEPVTSLGTGRIERWIWAAQDPFHETESPTPFHLIDAAPVGVLGDFSSTPPSAGALQMPLGLTVDEADRLFVAEAGANRVLVYDLPSRVLLRVISLAHPSDAGPRPLDLAAVGSVVYCVTADPPRLLALTAGGAPVELALDGGIGQPLRVASSPGGKVAILDRAAAKVRFLHGTAPDVDLAPPIGSLQPPAAHATDIAFENEDAIVVSYLSGDDFFRFRATGDPAADPELRPLKARGYDGLGIVRAPDGRIGFWTARGFRNAVAIRRKFGLWGQVLTFRLDSGDFQTQWGRLFLDACIPDGTSVEVTFAVLDEQDDDLPTLVRTSPSNTASLPPVARLDLSAPMPPASLAPEATPGGATWLLLHRRESGRELPWAQPLADDPFATYEAPILAPAGRYLWVWMRLSGDSRLTPKIRCLRAEHPSHDYLRRLPRAFSRDLAVADFLRRYLAVFEGFLGEAEARGVRRATLLDPAASPDELLPWLASFMGLVLDERWSAAQRRTLIAEIANLWRAKGTVCGLARFIEICMGVRPLIIEKFRLRGGGGAVLGSDCEPFTSSVLGAGFRIGGAVSDSAKGPLAPGTLQEAFSTHAHRFTVIIPAALNPEQLDVARAILEAQRPAHTLYDVCAIGAGMRVGTALHVGLSSIIGRAAGFEPLQLGSSALGTDAVLGRATAGARPGADRLGVGMRIG